MPAIFRIKTDKLNVLKGLFEILYYNSLSVSMQVDKQGMYIFMKTTQNLCFEILLNQFDTFEFNYHQPVYLEIDKEWNLFFKHISSTKNKEIEITLPELNLLTATVTTTTNEQHTTDSISVCVDASKAFGKTESFIYTVDPLVISGTDFNKLHKSLKEPDVFVTRAFGVIMFKTVLDNIYERSSSFGKQPVQARPILPNQQDGALQQGSH